MSGVIHYYENCDENSRFSRNSRKIEFLTSTTIFDGLIEKRSKILDVGAGPGAYSLYYAEPGHEVTAVDLTPKHIEIIKHKAEPKEYPIFRLLLPMRLILAEFLPKLMMLFCVLALCII